MKRDCDDAALPSDPSAMDEDLSKRNRLEAAAPGSQVCYLKMLLPEREVGNVIGKGGSVLKKICEESGARVRISAIDEVIPLTRERVATISGPLASLTLGQHLISKALSDAREASRELRGEPKAAEGGASEQQRVLKLLIPHVSCGVVMGKGGAFIKELMGASGALIKVSQPDEIIAATQERVATISGTIVAVDAAQDAIARRLSEAPPAQQIKETDYSLLKFNHSVGSYQQPPQQAPLSQMWGAYPQHRAGIPPAYQMAAVAAPPPALTAPIPYKHFIATLEDHVSPEMAAQKYSEYMRQLAAAAGGRAAPERGPATSGGAQVREEMPLGDKLVSGVIGKGGSVIKELIARSGALIKISQKTADNFNGERIVMISGTAEQVERAKQLVTERVKAIEAQQSGQPAGVQNPGAAYSAYAQHHQHQHQQQDPAQALQYNAALLGAPDSSKMGAHMGGQMGMDGSLYTMGGALNMGGGVDMSGHNFTLPATSPFGAQPW